MVKDGDRFIVMAWATFRIKSTFSTGIEIILVQGRVRPQFMFRLLSYVRVRARFGCRVRVRVRVRVSFRIDIRERLV